MNTPATTPAELVSSVFRVGALNATGGSNLTTETADGFSLRSLSNSVRHQAA